MQENDKNANGSAGGQRRVVEILDARSKVDDAAELTRTRRRDAAQIREALNYNRNGRLTWRIFDALVPLLLEPTPVAIKSVVGGERGARRHLLHQIRVMHDVVGPVHWSSLRHYEDAGRTVRVWVLLGNHLSGVKLDPRTGDLIKGDAAEILWAAEDWGGWDGEVSEGGADGRFSTGRADGRVSKGNLLRGSRTIALRSLLAELGPGRDVFEDPTAPRTDDKDTEALVDRVTYRPELIAIAGAGERKAHELDVKDLCATIRKRGFPWSQAANLIRLAAGREPIAYPDEEAARHIVRTVLDERRIVFAEEAVAPLRLLLEQTKPQIPGADPRLDRVPSGPGTAQAA
jgi:hypothetical protein